MAVSADEVGFFIVEETTYGVVPTSPTWLTLPVTSDSLATNAQTETSNLLDPDRQLLDSVLTGMDISGNLDTEVARTPAFDLVLESAMANDWDVTGAPDWTLTVSNTRKSFSLMKRFPDVASPGSYIYHIYKGCLVNTLTIDCNAGAPVTASIGLVGKEADADTSTIEPSGSTYPAVGDITVLRAPLVSNIVLDNAGNTLSTAIGDSCFTQLTININANVRGIQCLGTLGNKDTVLGTFEAPTDASIYFNTSDLMEAYLDQETVDLTYDVGDSSTGHDFYTFTMTKGKIASNVVAAGGKGDDVANQVTINWFKDDTLSPATTVTIDTKVIT